MGRYDFRPLRVHETATHMLKTEILPKEPSWYPVISNIPAAQALVRVQPLQHQSRKFRPKGTKKASKLFKPQKITYAEDLLRKQFFKDHPWELARPRMILEEDGKDSYKVDWSRIQQPARALSGESVVQRQLWLRSNPPKGLPQMTLAQAYDQARKEFYHLRLQEDVERRIAREEALSTGAYFGKSALDIGMELEDKEYENWKRWAEKEILTKQQRQAAMYTNFESEDMALGADSGEVNAGMEEVSDLIPAQEQGALGGAMVRPS